MGPPNALGPYELCGVCATPYLHHGIPLHLDGIRYADHQWVAWFARVLLNGPLTEGR